jgi:CRISPR/Cas system CSM-associated protein Csm4 (group 5 of RAMP superfamily)
MNLPLFRASAISLMTIQMYAKVSTLQNLIKNKFHIYFHSMLAYIKNTYYICISIKTTKTMNEEIQEQIEDMKLMWSTEDLELLVAQIKKEIKRRKNVK